MLWLASRALRGQAPRRLATQGAAGCWRLLVAYAATVLYVLANPTTLLAFGLLVPGLLGPAPRGTDELAVLGTSVFAGSFVWWMSLKAAAALARRRLTPGRLHGVNRVTGAVVACFGALLLAHAALPLFHAPTAEVRADAAR